MATLQSTSTRLACWRTFNQGSLGTLVAAAEIDVAAGGSTSYLHAQGAFNAELRKPQIVTTPLTPVLAAGARPGHTVPAATAPLFDFLCRRLQDSFGGPGGVARCLHLMHPGNTPQQLARTMIVDEWPAIRASLDAGQPVPLALVLVESADPCAAAAGGRLAFDSPLGLPLALRHGVLVFGNGTEIAAGYGNDVVLRADGSLTLG